MALTLRSAAFQDGGEIPRAHTCEGGDRSPPLTFSGVPAGANRPNQAFDGMSGKPCSAKRETPALRKGNTHPGCCASLSKRSNFSR